MSRFVCWLRGHCWSTFGYGGVGNFTGYVETRECLRCGVEEVVQVPQ